MRAAGRSTLLPHFAAAVTVATAATWAVLQGLDGVGLKQAVDAWYSASGADKAIRLANAETVRWLEWGFQSYFRVMLGVAFVLVGAGMLAGRRVAAGWLGWGPCSVACSQRRSG
jgi:pheromone shutdown protein TraB